MAKFSLLGGPTPGSMSEPSSPSYYHISHPRMVKGFADLSGTDSVVGLSGGVDLPDPEDVFSTSVSSAGILHTTNLATTRKKHKTAFDVEDLAHKFNQIMQMTTRAQRLATQQGAGAQEFDDRIRAKNIALLLNQYKKMLSDFEPVIERIQTEAGILQGLVSKNVEDPYTFFRISRLDDEAASALIHLESFLQKMNTHVSRYFSEQESAPEQEWKFLDPSAGLPNLPESSPFYLTDQFTRGDPDWWEKVKQRGKPNPAFTEPTYTAAGCECITEGPLGCGFNQGATFSWCKISPSANCPVGREGFDDPQARDHRLYEWEKNPGRMRVTAGEEPQPAGSHWDYCRPNTFPTAVTVHGTCQCSPNWKILDMYTKDGEVDLKKVPLKHRPAVQIMHNMKTGVNTSLVQPVSRTYYACPVTEQCNRTGGFWFNKGVSWDIAMPPNTPVSANAPTNFPPPAATAPVQPEVRPVETKAAGTQSAPGTAEAGTQAAAAPAAASAAAVAPNQAAAAAVAQAAPGKMEVAQDGARALDVQMKMLTGELRNLVEVMRDQTVAQTRIAKQQMKNQEQITNDLHSQTVAKKGTKSRTGKIDKKLAKPAAGLLSGLGAGLAAGLAGVGYHKLNEQTLGQKLGISSKKKYCAKQWHPGFRCSANKADYVKADSELQKIKDDLELKRMASYRDDDTDETTKQSQGLIQKGKKVLEDTRRSIEDLGKASYEGWFGKGGTPENAPQNDIDPNRQILALALPEDQVQEYKKKYGSCSCKGMQGWKYVDNRVSKLFDGGCLPFDDNDKFEIKEDPALMKCVKNLEAEYGEHEIEDPVEFAMDSAASQGEAKEDWLILKKRIEAGRDAKIKKFQRKCACTESCMGFQIDVVSWEDEIYKDLTGDKVTDEETTCSLLECKQYAQHRNYKWHDTDAAAVKKTRAAAANAKSTTEAKPENSKADDKANNKQLVTANVHRTESEDENNAGKWCVRWVGKPKPQPATGEEPAETAEPEGQYMTWAVPRGTKEEHVMCRGAPSPGEIKIKGALAEIEKRLLNVKVTYLRFLDPKQGIAVPKKTKQPENSTNALPTKQCWIKDLNYWEKKKPVAAVIADKVAYCAMYGKEGVANGLARVESYHKDVSMAKARLYYLAPEGKDDLSTRAVCKLPEGLIAGKVDPSDDSEQTSSSFEKGGNNTWNSKWDPTKLQEMSKTCSTECTAPPRFYVRCRPRPMAAAVVASAVPAFTVQICADKGVLVDEKDPPYDQIFMKEAAEIMKATKFSRQADNNWYLEGTVPFGSTNKQQRRVRIYKDASKGWWEMQLASESNGHPTEWVTPKVLLENHKGEEAPIGDWFQPGDVQLKCAGPTPFSVVTEFNDQGAQKSIDICALPESNADANGAVCAKHMTQSENGGPVHCCKWHPGGVMVGGAMQRCLPETDKCQEPFGPGVIDESWSDPGYNLTGANRKCKGVAMKKLEATSGLSACAEAATKDDECGQNFEFNPNGGEEGCKCVRKPSKCEDLEISKGTSVYTFNAVDSPAVDPWNVGIPIWTDKDWLQLPNECKKPGQVEFEVWKGEQLIDEEIKLDMISQHAYDRAIKENDENPLQYFKPLPEGEKPMKGLLPERTEDLIPEVIKENFKLSATPIASAADTARSASFAIGKGILGAFKDASAPAKKWLGIEDDAPEGAMSTADHAEKLAERGNKLNNQPPTMLLSKVETIREGEFPEGNGQRPPPTRGAPPEAAEPAADSPPASSSLQISVSSFAGEDPASAGDPASAATAGDSDSAASGPSKFAEMIQAAEEVEKLKKKLVQEGRLDKLKDTCAKAVAADPTCGYYNNGKRRQKDVKFEFDDKTLSCYCGINKNYSCNFLGVADDCNESSEKEIASGTGGEASKLPGAKADDPAKSKKCHHNLYQSHEIAGGEGGLLNAIKEQVKSPLNIIMDPVRPFLPSPIQNLLPQTFLEMSRRNVFGHGHRGNVGETDPLFKAMKSIGATQRNVNSFAGVSPPDVATTDSDRVPMSVFLSNNDMNNEFHDEDFNDSIPLNPSMHDLVYDLRDRPPSERNVGHSSSFGIIPPNATGANVGSDKFIIDHMPDENGLDPSLSNLNKRLALLGENMKLLMKTKSADLDVNVDWLKGTDHLPEAYRHHYYNKWAKLRAENGDSKKQESANQSEASAFHNGENDLKNKNAQEHSQTGKSLFELVDENIKRMRETEAKKTTFMGIFSPYNSKNQKCSFDLVGELVHVKARK